jgi:hypothetical protein
MIRDRPNEAGHLIPSHIKNKNTKAAPIKPTEDLNQTQVFR